MSYLSSRFNKCVLILMLVIILIGVVFYRLGEWIAVNTYVMGLLTLVLAYITYHSSKQVRNQRDYERRYQAYLKLQRHLNIYLATIQTHIEELRFHSDKLYQGYHEINSYINEINFEYKYNITTLLSVCVGLHEKVRRCINIELLREPEQFRFFMVTIERNLLSTEKMPDYIAKKANDVFGCTELEFLREKVQGFSSLIQYDEAFEDKEELKKKVIDNQVFSEAFKRIENIEINDLRSEILTDIESLKKEYDTLVKTCLDMLKK